MFPGGERYGDVDGVIYWDEKLVTRWMPVLFLFVQSDYEYDHVDGHMENHLSVDTWVVGHLLVSS
jgi:hypothetical protein